MSAKSAQKTTVSKANRFKIVSKSPTFIVMISEAINKLNEPRTGSSKQAITKYISANYNIDFTDKKQNYQLKRAINSGVETGKLKQTKGKGASGSFKIGDAAKEAEKLKAKKEVKKTTTKSTAKTSVATKTAKKSAADKASTKKVVKTTNKSPSKSPTKKTSSA